MRVFVIAGEPSGDKLGGALMAGLRELAGEVTFFGVGGPLMQAQGMESLFPMEELSVMGLAEILPRYKALHKRMTDTAAAVLDSAPDILITIDSPDFCLRVAKRVRAARTPHVPIAHYVAPTVWAWRPKRAQRMARHVDHVLALFPFEPPLMEAAGMSCDFTGHPVVAEPVAGPEDVAALRGQLGLGDAPVLLVLPGSRRGEVGRLAGRFGAALAPVLEARPDLRVVVPAAAPVAGMVTEAVAGWPGAPVVLDPRGMGLEEAAAAKRAAFAAADAALAASGTVALELAAAATPMVIGYDMSWLSRKIIGRMLLTDSVNLVNLVSETRVVPELLGEACTPPRLASALLDVLDDPGPQREAMALTMERLGQGGMDPGMRAAQSVMAFLERAGQAV